MKSLTLIGAFCLLLYCLCGPPVQAQEVVLNRGLEMNSTLYFTEYGALGANYRGVANYTTTGPSSPSLCYWASPFTNNSAGLSQTIFVQAGETYDVTANICYHNC